jgi:ParB-like chromosome segregation protein Spo0J
MSKHTERLEIVAIDKLIPYANNARTHSDDQIKKIQASLREFGFVNPVLIDKDCGIIAGHGRVEAAKREGITEVPCVWVEHLTEAQKKAYILADNKLAELAGWDFGLLSFELAELADFDMADFGFEIYSPDDYGTDFELPSGEKQIEQITFTLSREQAKAVREAIQEAKENNPVKRWGNENENGNALYRVVLEWEEQRT